MVCQWFGRLGFNLRMSHTKDSKEWYLMPPYLTFSIMRYGWLVGCFVLGCIKCFQVIYCQIKYQTILFSISTGFSSIWSIDLTHSGATTPVQSRPGSDDNERGTLHSPKLQHHWNLTIRLFSVIFKTLIGVGDLITLQRKQLVYSTAPADGANY